MDTVHLIVHCVQAPIWNSSQRECQPPSCGILTDLKPRCRLGYKGTSTHNPLPTNDAPMRHGLSISLWEFMRNLILGAILQYMVSATSSCFLWLVKG